jgi:hypothetical protein
MPSAPDKSAALGKTRVEDESVPELTRYPDAMSDGARAAVGPRRTVGVVHACANVPVIILPEYTGRWAAGSNPPVGPAPMRLEARTKARDDDRVVRVVIELNLCFCSRGSVQEHQPTSE